VRTMKAWISPFLWPQLIEALDAASRVPKPDVSSMFEDVYAQMPWNLREQV
jgi:TPP-dependent pyruvate/acetoin dehydrogenase alpha subunit